jgi:hypothetical protein
MDSMATQYLVPTPSLLRGIARVVDLFGGLDHGVRRASTAPGNADFEAVMGDWQAVAGDMAEAFRETGERVDEARRHGQAES